MSNYNQTFAGDDSIEMMHEFVEKNQGITGLSTKEIKLLQERKLKDMLAYAKEHSPWYKQSLAHIDVDKFKIADFEKIPIMNKRELMDNWNEIVTDKNLKLGKASSFLMAETDYDLFHGYHLFASGGSSGRRGMFVWSSDEVAETLAGFYRYRYRDDLHLQNINEPSKVVSVAAIKPVHFSETLFSLPLLPSMETLSLSALSPVDEVVDALNKYQPNHLNGYPSVIARLAAKAIKGDLNISPRRILVAAEPLLPNMLELMKSAWKGVIITNAWGSTDAGTHAVSCDHSKGNLHLMEDLVIVEPVDANNNPVAVGVTSTKILITNLHRKSMPIFRYEMDDTVRFLDEKCVCGSNHKLIGAIDGRKEDDFIYGDIIVIAELFENTIMPEEGIDEYQVFQTETGADIRLVPEKGTNIDHNKMQKDLVLQLEELGLKSPRISIKSVRQLERHADTGKLKRFNTLTNQKNKQSNKS
jgi:phenylacetate-CoA ligase